MLAISRALLFNPQLLVMDEPTEGLAPVIVQQVEAMLKSLAAEGEISVLLIEQNLGVAIEVADTVDVMVNGRIARSMPAARARRRPRAAAAPARREDGRRGRRSQPEPKREPASEEVQILTVQRAERRGGPATSRREERTVARAYTRWGSDRRRRPDRQSPGNDRRQSAGGRGSSSSRSRQPRSAPPTSPARSTPRAASCSTCAAASRSSACAR